MAVDTPELNNQGFSAAVLAQQLQAKLAKMEGLKYHNVHPASKVSRRAQRETEIVGTGAFASGPY
jgi:hypothetical protein